MGNFNSLVTTTTLLEHLSVIMKKLDSKEITTEEAKAQASLVKQSNNLLRYELDVQKFKMKIEEAANKSE